MTAADWLKTHLDHPEGDCLIWPYFRDPANGYGRLGYRRVQYWAHRLMCEFVNGPPPSDSHEASHSCGNGKGGCVHPKHLSWKTPAQNQRERRAHGTHGRNKHLRLTEAKVARIVAMKGVKTQREMALEYGVSQQTISMVQNNQTWIDGKQRKWGFQIKPHPRQRRVAQ